MTAPPPLALANVCLTYPGPPQVEALRSVDLTVDRGELVGVVGPSGAGKSSLLHVLGLLTTPTTGTVRLDGVSVEGVADRDLTRWRGRGIGFVFQAFHLMESRRAWENVALPLRYHGVGARECRDRAEAALREVGLEHRTHALARTLSGGERQRVAIARALVTEPAVLLCDEPTGNLDSENSATMVRLLRQLNERGRTIVVITHDEEIAASLPRVVRILDGGITADSGPARPGLRHASEVTGANRATTPDATAGDGRTPRTPRTRRLAPLDLLDEALAGLMDSGWRTALTCLGTVLGVATLVATLGLASTASTQVSKQFDRLTATTVSATSFDPRAYEEPQLARAAELNGVRAVAHLNPVAAAIVEQSPTRPEAVATSSLPVVGVTAGSWDVVRPKLSWGRTFDEVLDGRRVAVLGSAAARQAGVHGPIGSQSVVIGGRPYRVVGVFEDVERRTDLLLSVVIPARTAEADFGDQLPVKSTEVVVDTEVGAGRQVAAELPYALSPENPDALDVVPPPDPRQLRDDVDTDLTGLFVVLAAVTLLVGTVGIANTTLVAVMERVPEIGLRRALGAPRGSVRAQFMTESSLIGAVGGIVGALVGLVVVLGVALAKGWTPVLPREVILMAPLGGALVGVLAGYFPARRAARTDPTVALRH